MNNRMTPTLSYSLLLYISYRRCNDYRIFYDTSSHPPPSSSSLLPTSSFVIKIHDSLHFYVLNSMIALEVSDVCKEEERRMYIKHDSLESTGSKKT